MRRTSQAAALLCIGLTASGAWAEERRLASGLADHEEVSTWENETLSLGVSAGWLSGQSHEFVYDGSGNKVSELIWDMNHAFAFNADLGIQLIPALKLNAKGTWGIDIDSHMEDYDWMGLAYGQTEWTHRSIHEDTELDHFARFDINLQYDIVQTSDVVIGGLLGARFTGVQWSAYGGDFVYTTDPATTFRDDVFSLPDDTLGITYEQTWAVAYAGLLASIQTPSWRITGSVIGSPFALGQDDDEHWLRSLSFDDDFEPTYFAAASAEAAYLFGDHYQIFVNANAERYFKTEGDTEITDTSSGASVSLDGDVSGGDHENLQVSIGFRVTN
jgi:outer membrane protease